MDLPFKTPPVTTELHSCHVCRFYSSYLRDESSGIITFLGLLALLDDPTPTTPLSALCRIYPFNLSTINQEEGSPQMYCELFAGTSPDDNVGGYGKHDHDQI